MIDPRLERARQQAAQRRQLGVQFSPLQQFQPPPPSTTAEGGSFKDQMKAAVEQRKQMGLSGSGGGGGDGGRGWLGLVLNNPVTKTALKPLEVLDMGRRAAVLGVEEWAKKMPEWAEALMLPSMLVDEDKANADTRSNWDKMKSMDYGFGQISKDTGNKWLDRGIGLVGDIGLDPLTYLTFGAGKFAGASGRMAAAGKLQAADFSEEIVDKAARLGVNARLGQDARDTLGIGKAGMRFGTRNHNVRVPGTATLQEVLGEGLARGRNVVGDTKFGTKVREQRIDQDILPAAQRLLGGKGGMSARAAAAFVRGADQGRMSGKTFANEFAPRTTMYDDLEVDQRVAITHALEGGRIDGVTRQGREAFDVMRDAAIKRGATGIGKLDNYVMHKWTDEASEWLFGDSAEAAARRKVFKIDKTDSTGRAFERKIKPGTYDIDGQRITLVDGTIAEINDKLGKVAGVKILEDDISKLLKGYLGTVSRDVAQASAMKEFRGFDDLGRAVDFSDAGVAGRAVDDVFDVDVKATEKATGKAAKKEAARRQEMLDLERQLIKALDSQVMDTTKAARKQLQGVLRETIDQLQTASKSAKRALRESLRDEKNLTKQLAKLQNSTQKKIADAEKQLADALAKPPEKYSRAELAKMGVDRRVERRSAKRDLERQLEKLRADEAAIAKMIDDAGQFQNQVGGRLRGQQMVATGQSVARAGDDLVAQKQAIEGAQARLDAASGPVAPDAAVYRQERRAEVNAASRGVDDAKAEQQQLLGQTSDGIVDAQKSAATAAQDKQVYESALAAARADLDRATGVNPTVKREMRQSLDELEAVVRLYDPNDKAMAAITEMLADAQRMLNELVLKKNFTEPALKGWVRAAKAGDIQPVLVHKLREGWVRIGDNLFDDADGMVVRAEIEQMFKRIDTEVSSSGFTKLVDEYTAFFKAYATATPGFHLRNFLSATHVNYADGVGSASMVESMRLWKQFKKNPEGFMKQHWNDDIGKAFRATFGSGAGGNFSAAELGDAKRFGKFSDNFYTRASRWAGEWVEGPVRLAMALDTMKRGGTDVEALARITRNHFDYSQLSKLDRRMKRLVPFWTFMSRNLPLQMQQMWLKPKAYAHYQSLVRNFNQANGDEKGVPLWWRERGAFKVGHKALGGNDVYLMPDLQHVDLKSELSSFLDPQRFGSSFNPIAKVPFETMVADRKMFTGQGFRDDESKLWYAIRNLIPPTSQADRLLFDQSDYAKERRLQTRLNYLGIPIKELTKGQMEAELRRLAREGS
jgi:hypothetical protein